ncbi:B12-binding domain-containing radical SAM protein [Lichenihabitans sp. PAMC28606]|uniref:B12-binding domain-containing radical SAM protein n=1 Tax=Lichenihabitans sp. PAMC28606 TaxID=2880932 RepID=UPI001D0AD508|nr:B12-binding domain-containing radical SAM protein [Lichenihabitans sp. PAMC28606]UDL96087.1 B12-binding domain-containing radical SAM protein [Lichenihabitans sp. PAMC28606]
MRCTVPVTRERRILCVFPAYTPSFGTFSGAYSLMNVQAFMPPQGLLVIAAYLPERWSMRFIDENLRAAADEDFAWADAVFVSGMHVQEPQIRDIHERAKQHGKVTALGGSSASAAPEKYAYFDYLHIGELGDATDRLVEILDADVTPPASQIVLETKDRTPLSDFPLPSYSALPLKKYLLGSLQFSSGCPYRCEFCDIPALYGRQPRLKSVEQLLAELDAFIAQPSHPAVIYFVDDNFIGNRKATKDMLPHLVAWQKKHAYPLQFACEATLNIAKQTDILELMREAGFFTVFVGIETPELDALKSIAKDHNNAVPMMGAIKTLNDYGLEVTSGIILGLDTETDASENLLKEFVDRSAVPVLTINLLQALPKTPLWDRLTKENRLVNDPSLESNVRFLRPHDEVVASWRRAIAHAYAPENIFARFRYQMDHTYGNRMKTPARGKLTRSNLRRAFIMGKNIIWQIGVKSDYRGEFWRSAWHAAKKGQIEAIFNMGFVCHHLIRFTREALRGEHNASFYAAKASAKEAANASSVSVNELQRSA